MVIIFTFVPQILVAVFILWWLYSEKSDGLIAPYDMASAETDLRDWYNATHNHFV